MSSTVLEDVEQLQKLFGNLQAQASVFDRHLTEIGLTKEQLGKVIEGCAQAAAALILECCIVSLLHALSVTGSSA